MQQRSRSDADLRHSDAHGRPTHARRCGAKTPRATQLRRRGRWSSTTQLPAPRWGCSWTVPHAARPIASTFTGKPGRSGRADSGGALVAMPRGRHHALQRGGKVQPSVDRLDGLEVPSSGDWDLRVWLEDAAGNASRDRAAGPLRLSLAGTSGRDPGVRISECQPARQTGKDPGGRGACVGSGAGQRRAARRVATAARARGRGDPRRSLESPFAVDASDVTATAAQRRGAV